jgi:hypothetical protein
VISKIKAKNLQAYFTDVQIQKSNFLSPSNSIPPEVKQDFQEKRKLLGSPSLHQMIQEIKI